jgi:hypothetical protein
MWCRCPTASPPRRARQRLTPSLAKPWQIRLRHRLPRQRLQDEHCSLIDSYYGRVGVGGRGPAAAVRRWSAWYRRWGRRIHDRPKRRQCPNQDDRGACGLLLRNQPSLVDSRRPAWRCAFDPQSRRRRRIGSTSDASRARASRTRCASSTHGPASAAVAVSASQEFR